MRQWYYVYITCANLYSVSYPLCVKHFGRDDWAVVKIEGSFEKIASYKRIYGKSNIILVYGTFCGNNDRDLRVLIGLERGWKNCEFCFCGIRIIHGAVWCLIESFEVAFDLWRLLATWPSYALRSSSTNCFLRMSHLCKQKISKCQPNYRQ